MPATIREASAQEIPFLCDSIAALDLWKELRIASPELQYACTHDPARIVYVAEKQGQLHGCIMFRPTFGVDFLCERVFRSGVVFPPNQPGGISPRQLPEGGYINMLAVFNGSQGRGFGAQLLQAAEQITSLQSERAYLCVSQINPRARAFYERVGYCHVADARDCIRKENTEHLMVKQLSKSTS